jgi:hypothetical protein
VIREWPYTKLQRWYIYDETQLMLTKAKAAMPHTPDDVVIARVIQEQEREGWVGLYKAEDTE